ncbi:transporter [Gluconobacter oxydans]|uniref:ComEC/Rec2 family competence protein n=1 Tax=Gluconobacter thailandicus TaxID=257438 RepID=UPI0002999262|nr:ComEC/Rec2 family competence protein [Gluconobacter thailandicus]AFW00447.1 DNA uptake protein [Gluconobacter oxydans H24]ANQ40814.1 transporter [Gluconobacter oxydans]
MAEQGRRLFGWLPVVMALGALVFLTPRFNLPIGPALICLPGAGAAAWIFRNRPPLRFQAFLMIALAGGYLDAAWQTARQPPMPALPTRATVVTGRVLAVETLPPRFGEDESGRRIVLAQATFETPVDAGMAPLRRTLRLKLRDDDPASPKPGSLVQIRAMLRAPSPPSFPGGRDLQREAWFSGAAGSGYAVGMLTPLNSQSSSRLEALRENIAARIEATLPGQTGAIAATLLAGETGRIDATTRQDFSASGLAHLLAVAGLHLGLVMAAVAVSVRALLTASERFALYWPCREIAALVGLSVGSGYVLLTGAHLPSVRALGMAVLVTLALLTGRRVLSMRSLAIIALAILLVSPVAVLDVSFQMSFAAVMGLIAGYEALREPLTKLRGEGGTGRVILSHLTALSLTSLLAGLATLPVSMAHFGAFQPWFVLANLLAVPLAAVWIMPAGLISLLLMPIHASAVPLMVMGWGIQIVQVIARTVAAFPLAHEPVPQMPGWGLLIVLLGMCLLCLWKGRARLAGLMPILVGLFSIWLASRPNILVSPDAGLIAVRAEGVLQAGPHSSLERLTLQDWQQALALPVGILPPDCLKGLCRVTVKEQAVLLRVKDTSDGAIPPSAQDCQGVSLFISASPARNACPGVPFIDRFSVWRNGAYAVYLRHGAPVLLSDRSWRGDRPWVPAIGSHGMPNLPLAQAE